MFQVDMYVSNTHATLSPSKGEHLYTKICHSYCLKVISNLQVQTWQRAWIIRLILFAFLLWQVLPTLVMIACRQPPMESRQQIFKVYKWGAATYNRFYGQFFLYVNLLYKVLSYFHIHFFSAEVKAGSRFYNPAMQQFLSSIQTIGDSRKTFNGYTRRRDTFYINITIRLLAFVPYKLCYVSLE